MSEKPREWKIKGGCRGDGPDIIHCDGPVPSVNEAVRVIEHSAFEAMKLSYETMQELNSRLLSRIDKLRAGLREAHLALVFSNERYGYNVIVSDAIACTREALGEGS